MKLIVTAIIWLVLATIISVIAYRRGLRDGRRMWISQCHALITVIEINQKAAHTPMVNGDRVIEALGKFVGDKDDETIFVPTMEGP